VIQYIVAAAFVALVATGLWMSRNGSTPSVNWMEIEDDWVNDIRPEEQEAWDKEDKEGVW
jgi:hypothetical protein